MTVSIASILAERARGLSSAQRRRAWVTSGIVHLAVAGAVWGSAHWKTTPPPRPIAPVVRIVPPAALGIPQPAPPQTRKKPEPKTTPAPPPPPPPPPAAKPKPKATPPPPPAKPDVPVIATKKPKPRAPEPSPPPPSPVATPPPPALPEVVRRRGILRGNPLGSSSSASVGVEDPDFTYGYYIDGMVTHIGQYWTRPNIAQRLEEAQVYYRILPDGRITDLRLIQSSGSTTFDEAAMRAIQAAVPLPPLPRGYKKDYLGITLVVQ